MIYAVAIIIATLLAIGSILIHFQALSLLDRTAHRIGSHRKRLVYTMIGLLFAHSAEIWLYGGAYALLGQWPEFGELSDQSPSPGWFDPVYYSAMVYTTVGFGDVVPSGAFRTLTATEALVGLSLITWSASFAFIQMQKVWR